MHESNKLYACFELEEEATKFINVIGDKLAMSIKLGKIAI